MSMWEKIDTTEALTTERASVPGGAICANAEYD